MALAVGCIGPTGDRVNRARVGSTDQPVRSGLAPPAETPAPRDTVESAHEAQKTTKSMPS